jgi:uncharacterized protein
MKYERFHLVLMATHACNLRCDYCYTGRKFPRFMPADVGRTAIGRALRSLTPGGVLELGFFGGEPLLEADLVANMLHFAQQAAEPLGVRLRPGITTNGTVLTASAWQLLTDDGLDVCISHDGLPEAHDRHRRTDGRGGAEQVAETIRRLQGAGRDVRVAMVVRPDTAALLPEGIRWLFDRGVRRFDLTLDVWAAWDRAGVEQLEEALVRTADLWRRELPKVAINWFDEKAAHVAGIPIEPCARCGFGDGEIAVAPSGNLYPCERLIGEDAADQPTQLPGRVFEGADFCRGPAPGRSAAACSACALQGPCNTTCRCNNYVRTGDVGRPDALLCLLERVCYRETARVLRKLQPA